jgi:hypothetical protein
MHYVTFDTIIDSCMQVTSCTTPTIATMDGLLVVIDSKLLKRKEDKGFKGKDQELVESICYMQTPFQCMLIVEDWPKKPRVLLRKG